MAWVGIVLDGSVSYPIIAYICVCYISLVCVCYISLVCVCCISLVCVCYISLVCVCYISLVCVCHISLVCVWLHFPSVPSAQRYEARHSFTQDSRNFNTTHSSADLLLSLYPSVALFSGLTPQTLINPNQQLAVCTPSPSFTTEHCNC